MLAQLLGRCIDSSYLIHGFNMGLISVFIKSDIYIIFDNLLFLIFLFHYSSIYIRLIGK